MSLLPLLLASDLPLQRNVPAIEWRNTLMGVFLSGISPEGMQRLTNDLEDNYCGGMEGIYCQGEVLTTIEYQWFLHGNFNIRALPHSVAFIKLERCGQTFAFDTRSLPRNLVYLNLDYNDITGHVDFTNLPEQLQTIRLMKNHVTGPIKLTKLPRTLKEIYLTENFIHQHTIWYDDLPETLKYVSVREQRGEPKGGVHAIRAVFPENATQKSIFFGSKKRR